MDQLNDSDIEVRVTELEEDVVLLQHGLVSLADDLDDVETVNILQQETLNSLTDEINDNEDDIEGRLLCCTETQMCSSSDKQDLVVLMPYCLFSELDDITSGLTLQLGVVEDTTALQESQIADLETQVSELDSRLAVLESGGGSNITGV